MTMAEAMNTTDRSFDALDRERRIGSGRAVRRDATPGGAAGQVWYCSRMDEREREAIELLAHVPVFEALGPRELTRVAAVSVPRSFDPGHVIFREGDASDTCYIVRSGHARAIRAHGDGRTLTLAHFGPGDIFGELAMFDDERRSATVETLDQVEAIAVLGPDMRRLLREHPEISVKLVIALGRRLREANARIARQSFQTVQSRVAGVLGQLVIQAQAEGAGNTDVLVVVTQSDVAQLAGSSRESASRFLAVLERAGVVTQGRGRVIVHDPEALQRYVY
jgi:CRP-like cAMP-binding protein